MTSFKTEVILNLFQDPTGQVIRLKYTQHVGCRNKFGMTGRVKAIVISPSEFREILPLSMTG
jgi:hypothetical protein